MPYQVNVILTMYSIRGVGVYLVGMLASAKVA